VKDEFEMKKGGTLYYEVKSSPNDRTLKTADQNPKAVLNLKTPVDGISL